eukprot:Pgem_evm1s4222
MWYSFDYGLIHFIQISTETDFLNAPEGENARLPGGPFGNQLDWLKNDLEKAVTNRATVPWIVVSGHRPLYTGVKAHGVSNCVECQTAFERLFIDNDVD